MYVTTDLVIFIVLVIAGILFFMLAAYLAGR